MAFPRLAGRSSAPYGTFLHAVLQRGKTLRLQASGFADSNQRRIGTVSAVSYFFLGRPNPKEKESPNETIDVLKNNAVVAACVDSSQPGACRA
jgi:hypothetical protein